MGADKFQDHVRSILDTDLYKLTMQCVIHTLYPEVRKSPHLWSSPIPDPLTHQDVTYGFTNRTPNLKLNKAGFEWLQQRVNELASLKVTSDELQFLRKECRYLDHGNYFEFLSGFQLRPSEHVKLDFAPEGDSDYGQVGVQIEGLWVDTILYEIPLLSLISEAYFKFVDTEWTHEGQRDKAVAKGTELLQNGCIFSEFGTRRRRDYHTQELVMEGLAEAGEKVSADKTGQTRGKFTGTSNVHFAHRFGVMPVGTVAHEWFMGVAAYTDDYVNATETALTGWMECFGRGILSIALTDTFGTPAFLRAFRNPVPHGRMKLRGGWSDGNYPVFANAFAGVRQDSGDPKEFIRIMAEFYEQEKIHERKTIVFSDSLNVEKCLELKALAEQRGFAPSFGIGTFLTNDFTHADGSKSVPMNIVIKLWSADGRPAIKLSDDLGKNIGDDATVQRVKDQLGYVDKHWEGADETKRW